MTDKEELEAMRNEIKMLEEKQAIEAEADRLREKLRRLKPKSLFRKAAESVAKEIKDMMKDKRTGGRVRK